MNEIMETEKPMSKCCHSYEKKGKFCKDCPKREKLSKKERKKLITKKKKSWKSCTREIIPGRIARHGTVPIPGQRANGF